MPKPEIVETASVPEEMPFCAAVRVGELIFASGSLGNVVGEMRPVEGVGSASV